MKDVVLDNFVEDVIKKRRAVRLFSTDKVPDEVIRKALELAILSPNSCNLQLWQFFWIKDLVKRKELETICLSQSSIRSASQVIVAVARPDLWKKRNNSFLNELDKQRIRMSPSMEEFQRKFIEKGYSLGFLGLKGFLKYILKSILSRFYPIQNGPCFFWERQIIAVKSSSLACQTFMLSIESQGFQTCPLEGYDSRRLKKLLALPFEALPLMVISVGKKSPAETQWPRVRNPFDEVVTTV